MFSNGRRNTDRTQSKGRTPNISNEQRKTNRVNQQVKRAAGEKRRRDQRVQREVQHSHPRPRRFKTGGTEHIGNPRKRSRVLINNN